MLFSCFLKPRRRAFSKQHPGCIRTPTYGHSDGPLSFCQSHKKAGMYTNPNGNLLMATRDGNGKLLRSRPR